MTRTILAVVFCAASLAITQPASAAKTHDDIDALRKDVESLKAGQEALRRELTAIKELLTAQQRGHDPVQDVRLTLEVTDSPTMGPADAPVTLVEYSDYQCPFCARHVQTVMPELEKNYVRTGKLRYVLQDFPLTSIHPLAAKAHEAAHCAGEQGKYWQMHHQLFANQKALQAEQLPKYAEAAGVADLTAFRHCLDSGKYAERNKASVAAGAKAGVAGTPSFLVGLTEVDGSVKTTKLIRGAQPYAVFQKAIDALLATD